MEIELFKKLVVQGLAYEAAIIAASDKLRQEGVFFELFFPLFFIEKLRVQDSNLRPMD